MLEADFVALTGHLIVVRTKLIQLEQYKVRDRHAAVVSQIDEVVQLIGIFWARDFLDNVEAARIGVRYRR